MRVSYVIRHHNGTMQGRDGNHSWEKPSEAVEQAIQILKNPRDGMDEQHKAYWQSQTFTISKVIHDETDVLSISLATETKAVQIVVPEKELSEYVNSLG